MTVPVAIIALLLGFYIGSLKDSPAPSNNVREESGKPESTSTLFENKVIPVEYPGKVNYPVRNLNPLLRSRHPIGSFSTFGEEEKRKKDNTETEKDYFAPDKENN